MKLKPFLPLLLPLLLWQPLAAQVPAALTLPEAIAQTLAHSAIGQQAATTRETCYWAWRGYQATYRPQLGLAGTLPNFSRAIAPVVQPDGTTRFQSIRINSSDVGLTLSQNIALTGGQVFVGSVMQRFDDFNGNLRRYNNQPFALGLTQPLGQFNALRWARRIEPLRYQESQRQFVEDRETIAQRVTELYFDVLLQQVNAEVARQNATATAELLRIGQERYRLGRLSQSDLLQLELNLLNARQAQTQAQINTENAAVDLQAYTGLTNAPALAVPEPAPQPAVVPALALAQARQHRSATLAFRRRLLQAERDVAQARGTTGFRATLTASMGYVNQAPTLGATYLDLQNQQQVGLAFSVPLVDWGRQRAIIKTTELNRDQTQHAVAQEERSFEQTVLAQAGQFAALAEQLRLAGRADSLAQRRYGIARATYLLGRISLTDLSLASNAKDGARRDYIFALRSCWVAHFRLRALTLYDFEKQTPIVATR